MSILDSLWSCMWFNPEYSRNTVSSMVAGVLFFSGWWFLIDAVSISPESVDASHWICGILGTVSLFMVNSVTNNQINGDAYNGGCMEARGAKIWLFVGFVLGFASVMAAIWIMSADFTDDKKDNHWVGVSLLLQNMLIFISSLVYKFGRTEELWN